MEKTILIEEIRRTLQMMGLPTDNSFVISEALIGGGGKQAVYEFTQGIEKLLGRGGKTLTSEEKSMLTDFIDQARKYETKFDSFGSLGDDLTEAQLKTMKNFITSKSNSTLKRVLADAAQEYRIYLKKIPIATEEEAYDEAFRDLITSAGRRTSYSDVVEDMNYLSYNYKTGSIYSLQTRIDKLRTIADALPEGNLKNSMNSFIDEMDDVVSVRYAKEIAGEESTEFTEKELDELIPDNELAIFKNAIEEVADEDTPVIRIDFSDPIDEISESVDDMTAKEVDDNLKEEFMTQMKKVCNTGFCSTMQGYYRSKSPKFQQMWDLILVELDKGVKANIGNIQGSVSEKELAKYKELLRLYKESNKPPLTKNDYIKIGEAVYEKWRGGGFMDKVSLAGLFGTKEQAFYTIARIMLGNDVFSGKWMGWGPAMKKWLAMNAIIALWDLGHGVWQLKFGSANPQETEESIIKTSAVDLSKNIASLVGGPPIYRLGLFIATKTVATFMPSTIYVNEEDLVAWIKEDSKTTYNPGYTDLEIYDNIIRKKGVTISYQVNDKPPYTRISGIKDPTFDYYNGDYTWNREGEWDYNIRFKKEGSKISRKQEKTNEIPKEVYNSIEDQLATNSLMSSYIKDRLTGIFKKHKKHIDYKKQEMMTDDSGNKIVCLIYEYDDVEYGTKKIAFNYTEYSKSDKNLNNTDTFNKIVKEYNK
jgi:hypothetical protein